MFTMSKYVSSSLVRLYDEQLIVWTFIRLSIVISDVQPYAIKILCM